MFGFGSGPGWAAETHYPDAVGYGGGGAGGFNVNSGAGGAGIVIVWEYK